MYACRYACLAGNPMEFRHEPCFVPTWETGESTPAPRPSLEGEPERGRCGCESHFDNRRVLASMVYSTAPRASAAASSCCPRSSLAAPCRPPRRPWPGAAARSRSWPAGARPAQRPPTCPPPPAVDEPVRRAGEKQETALVGAQALSPFPCSHHALLHARRKW
eukprot:SAG22_NODE_359_length_11758_cov_4.094254_18_plen_163_part_00